MSHISQPGAGPAGGTRSYRFLAPLLLILMTAMLVFATAYGGSGSNAIAANKDCDPPAFLDGGACKVNICHATGSVSNPYVFITVSENALNGHFSGNHQQNEDIIGAANAAACPGGPPPPTDVCPNIGGDQATVPAGYTLVNGQCIANPPPPVDVCPNIGGDQATVPAGYTLVNGQCIANPPPPVDVCPNIGGDQATVPAGYTLVNGQCVEDPPQCTAPAFAHGGTCKVNICHATGSVTNPYVFITINESGLNGHFNGNHQQNEDIIGAANEAACPGGPPPVDVCPNIGGDQATVPAGYTLVNGQCIEDTPPPVDVCPNIGGDQATVPAGYTLVNGQCIEDTPPEECVPPAFAHGGTCKVNICHATGSQSNPYVFITINVNGLNGHFSGNHQQNEDIIGAANEAACPGGPPPTDVCPNIDGAQAAVPAGYTLVNGQCVLTPPTDVCPNIDGAQATVPAGYTLTGGQCVQNLTPPTDVCPNIEGNQATVPAGFTLTGGQCVADQVPVDLCPNITGTQTTVPAGLELVDGACSAQLEENECPDSQREVTGANGETACVSDTCPNVTGFQTKVPDTMILVNGECVVDTPTAVADENQEPQGELPYTGAEQTLALLLGAMALSLGALLWMIPRPTVRLEAPRLAGTGHQGHGIRSMQAPRWHVPASTLVATSAVKGDGGASGRGAPPLPWLRL